MSSKSHYFPDAGSPESVIVGKPFDQEESVQNDGNDPGSEGEEGVRDQRESVFGMSENMQEEAAKKEYFCWRRD